MTPGEELLFLALGGSGEIGMNVNLYGCRGKWLMADLGLTFADSDYPGIDLILPDLEFIEQRMKELVGIVLTHGHIDHVHGLAGFDSYAEERSHPRPEVIAHANVPARFERYRMTAGYNAEINRRQFQVEELSWPTEYRSPDTSYLDDLDLEVGEEVIHLHHAKA